MQYVETAHITAAQRQDTREKLWEYNLTFLEDNDPKDLGIFVKGESENVVGSLIGWTLGQWLTIDYLWVDEAFRGREIGSELLLRTEAAAEQRGCRHVFLDTMQFQAPAFYEKHGYQQIFVLDEYPLTGKRYYYRKTL
ncbi:MAG: GNAT family N-acetyltransferase [Ruthenibacterium sp.]